MTKYQLIASLNQLINYIQFIIGVSVAVILMSKYENYYFVPIASNCCFSQGFATFKPGGDTIFVSTASELKTALNSQKQSVIILSGLIKGTGIYYTTSNKSIIGIKGTIIEGITLGVTSVENVLIQNIVFRYQISDPGILIKYNAKNITVDHCEFYQDRTHGWDYWGKHISITRGADMVTISYCYFHDANLSVLIGGGLDSSNVKDDYGKLHVTLHHNFFQNISEREPTVMTGSVHMYNNYHLDNGGYCIGARAGAQIKVNNDAFIRCKLPMTTVFEGEPPGFIGESGCGYSGSGKNNISTPAFLWGAPYTFKAAPANTLKTTLPNLSGATL